MKVLLRIMETIVVTILFPIGALEYIIYDDSKLFTKIGDIFNRNRK